MATKKDYYEVLGIDRTATQAQIKSAYRKLAKKYHPDVNPGNEEAKKKFEEIGEAYSVLSDPQKRKQYDQFGFAGFDAGGGGSEFQGAHTYKSPDGTTYYYSSSGTQDMGDMFGDLFSDLFGRQKGHGGFHQSFTGGFGGNGFSGAQGFGGSSFGGSQGFNGSGFGAGQGFGGAYSSGGAAAKGTDLHTDVTISFDEAVRGCKRKISLREADGSTHTLEISIPAGIDEGQSVRIRGKGNPGAGGEAGDLLIRVHVTEKEGFERRGQDLYTSVRVPFMTAVLGGSARVPTLDGIVEVTVPEGMQPGRKLRLRGKGMPAAGGKSAGDLYVEIQIRVPQNISAEARQKLMEFDRLTGGEGERARQFHTSESA